jgi:hypothetical protein
MYHYDTYALWERKSNYLKKGRNLNGIGIAAYILMDRFLALYSTQNMSRKRRVGK